jgi:hypothetical protein
MWNNLESILGGLNSFNIFGLVKFLSRLQQGQGVLGRVPNYAGFKNVL